MKRATPVLLFLGSSCASVYAFLSIRKMAFLSLAGAHGIGGPNDPNALDDLPLYKEYWTQGLIWLLFAVLLTMAFLLTARGRWRFAAGLPLTLCAFVVLGLVVQPYPKKCDTPQCVNERCPPPSQATLYGPEWERREVQEKWLKCRLIQDPRRFLEQARAIVLVRVEELTPPFIGAWGPSGAPTTGPSNNATLRVIKSWKGPYSAGRILHVEAPVIVSCHQFDCTPYVFQPDDKELLITRLGDRDQDPIAVWENWVWPAATSQALMDALDQAVVQCPSCAKLPMPSR
jgi:hypothetical protein